MNNLDEYSLEKLQDMAHKVDKNINIIKVDIFTNYCKVTYLENQKESNIQKELRCPLYTSFEGVIAEIIINKKNNKKLKTIYTLAIESLKKIHDKIFQHIGNTETPNSDSGIKSELPKPKNRIPMPECKPPKKTISDLDVLKELLTNPRVEGITINIDKVGEVSNMCINARIKEIPQILKIDEKTLSKEDIDKLSSEFKQCNLSIGSES